MFNDEKLLIMEMALRNGLLVFLFSFVAFAGYALLRLRRRKRRLSDYFDERYVSAFQEIPSQEEKKEHFKPRFNRLRSILRALLLAAFCGGVGFVVSAFVPFPFLHNFATSHAWKTAPLRLTTVTYDRFHEGFSLEGEVWNQTEEPLEVNVVVTIRDNSGEVLDELNLPLEPTPLGPGRAGKFDLRYTEHSPFLAGYQIRFVDSQGLPVPHQEGFDVR